MLTVVLMVLMLVVLPVLTIFKSIILPSYIFGCKLNLSLLYLVNNSNCYSSHYGLLGPVHPLLYAVSAVFAVVVPTVHFSV